MKNRVFFAVLLFLFLCLIPLSSRGETSNSTDGFRHVEELQKVITSSPEYAFIEALKSLPDMDWSTVMAIRILQLLRENNRLLTEIRDLLQSQKSFSEDTNSNPPTALSTRSSGNLVNTPDLGSATRR